MHRTEFLLPQRSASFSLDEQCGAASVFDFMRSGLAEFYIEFEEIPRYVGAVGLGDARLDRLRSAAAR